MTDQHPIVPSFALVTKLQDLGKLDAIQLAYQAGADQELKECLMYASDNGLSITRMRTARRPQLTSLKEQALALLQPGEPRLLNSKMQDTIRAALEALPND